MANESYIFIPKFEDVTLLSPTSKVKGRFIMFKGKDNGYREKVADWTDNLITNGGIDRLGTGIAINYIGVGTSNTPPSFGDSSLYGPLKSADLRVGWTAGGGALGVPGKSVLPVPPYTVTVYKGVRFTPGQATGNLAEVATCWTLPTATVSYGIFSRALIKDALGNPTTITVLADEYLDVIYGLEQYPDLNTYNYNIDISGVTYGCTTAAAFCGNSGYWLTNTITWPQYCVLKGSNSDILGDVTVGITGETSLGTVTIGTYVPGSLSKTTQWMASLTTGNLTKGIRTISQNIINTDGYSFGHYKTLLSDYIPKTNTKILTLNVLHSWGRYVA